MWCCVERLNVIYYIYFYVNWDLTNWPDCLINYRSCGLLKSTKQTNTVRKSEILAEMSAKRSCQLPGILQIIFKKFYTRRFSENEPKFWFALPAKNSANISFSFFLCRQIAHACLNHIQFHLSVRFVYVDVRSIRE